MSITGPADLRDQRWLDERIVAARDGIEAVIEIALNWTDGRHVGRLHPGVAPADYVRERVGIVGKGAIVPLLTQSNWSNRQIAAVAGVSEATVRRAGASNDAPARPAESLGADGKIYPARRVAREDGPLDPAFERATADLELNDVHRAKFPELAHADFRVDLTQALYAFGRPGKFNAEEWAARLPEFRPEDIALVRQHLAYIRRWLEKWERLLDRPSLSLVEGSPE